jgi:hypothetical protein
MAQYNSGVQKDILECTTGWSLSQMGYFSRRPHLFLSYLAKNKKEAAPVGTQSPTVDNLGVKNIPWFDISRFQLRHADGRVRFWRKQYGPILHCFNGTGWCRGCNGVGNVFLVHIKSFDTN